MVDWNEGLTEKQRRFVEAYAANGGNATEAARAAGYRKPHPQGAENLQKPTIKDAIEKLRGSTTTAAVLTREERQAFWSQMVRGDAQDGDGNPPSFRDRLRASELLARSQGDFLDRQETTSDSMMKEFLDSIMGTTLPVASARILPPESR